MSLRIFASVMSVGIFALAAVMPLQTASQTTVLAGIELAQSTQPTSASSKTAKSKVKKKKQQNGGSGSGAASPQPAPAGPPDPGKY